MTRRLATALALAACSALLAACGGDEEGEPIPQDIADNAVATLDDIQAQIENGSVGACEDILEPGQNYEELAGTVQRVPQRVDADIRDALDRSVDRLRELVQQECDRLAEEEAQQEEEQPTDTTEIPEETVPEETVPEETVPEETVPEEEGEGNQEPGQNGTPPGLEGAPPGQEGDSGGVPVPGDDG
jgi:hypothetical protein